MTEITVTMDFSKVFINSSGEPTKDMLDPPVGRTLQNAPDLTYGSFIANALMIGIRTPPKNAVKYYQIASQIEYALKEKNGKLEYSEGDISKLEDALQQVKDEQFQQVFFTGAIQLFLDQAKKDLFLKQQSA